MCIADGTSYKCACSDGSIVTTSCVISTSTASSITTSTFAKSTTNIVNTPIPTPGELFALILELVLPFVFCLCCITDPCVPNPCGSLGKCIADGTSYKCACSDGSIVTISCVIPTSTASSITTSTSVKSMTTIAITPTPTPGKLLALMLVLVLLFVFCLCCLTDPCVSNPCGSLGKCIADGTSYKCACSDGSIVTTSCVIPTSTASSSITTSMFVELMTTIAITPTPTPGKLLT